MDWWNRVPSRLPPLLSGCKKVTRGEGFHIFPVFAHIGIAEEEAHVTWSFKFIDPSGNISQHAEDLEGLSGKGDPKGLILSHSIATMTFTEEHAYGIYQIEVAAVDHIRNQDYTVQTSIELAPFQYQPDEIDIDKWFKKYPVDPQPRDTLYHFTTLKEGTIFKKNGRINPCVWFYKTVFEQNPFLIQPTLDFYQAKASKKQKKDLLLLFHLLGKSDAIEVEKELQPLAHSLEDVHFPDPYREITTGDQLDMLWCEYFATARIQPIKHLLSALELGIYAGTLEKVKSGELDKNDPIVNENAKANAVFNAAIWSLKSNCMQSPLLFHYCIGLYETAELTDRQKTYLGSILNFVSKEKKKNSDMPQS